MKQYVSDTDYCVLKENIFLNLVISKQVFSILNVFSISTQPLSHCPKFSYPSSTSLRLPNSDPSFCLNIILTHFNHQTWSNDYRHRFSFGIGSSLGQTLTAAKTLCDQQQIYLSCKKKLVEVSENQPRHRAPMQNPRNPQTNPFPNDQHRSNPPHIASQQTTPLILHPTHLILHPNHIQPSPQPHHLPLRHPNLIPHYHKHHSTHIAFSL